MARRRARKKGNWRPARDGKRMIQYYDDGTYWRHVSMADYRKVKANSSDLRRLLKDGMTILKALRLLGLPSSAGILDLALWILDE